MDRRKMRSRLQPPHRQTGQLSQVEKEMPLEVQAVGERPELAEKVVPRRQERM